MPRRCRVALVLLLTATQHSSFLAAQEPPPGAARPAAATTTELGDLPALTRLSPHFEVWIDPKRKLVVVDGKVVLREGLLEMFACPRGTKEHESIVAVNSNAQFVHAGLVAVGANPGHPVQYDPEYKSASGPIIDIWVLWKDEQGGQHKVKAQDWVQQTKTGEAMQSPWVFGGSVLTTDETTGKKYYLADGGDFICVSNFGSAMLDLPVESSQSNQDLAFKAFTDRIPPLGTPVRLVLQPRSNPKPGPATADHGKSAAAKSAGKSESKTP